MSASTVHTMVRYEGEAAVIDCLDVKLNEELTIQAWGEELTNTVQNIGGYQRVIVNFQNVKFMSSSALRVLITLNQTARSRKLALFLCCINPNILEVFKITKLDSLFKIRATEAEAVHSKL
ncbi:MAG: STAS domain-containing protein [Thermoguttaceae bacterium]|nr:STAS domain-containing protein [Thermoguttaceae bacterium]